MISLSVVIPAFNEENYIGETLAALRASASQLSQTDATAELVVVNHSSTDSTVAKAAEADRVISLAQGCSIGAVRNFGAQNSTGEFIVFVDADTIVPLNFLPALLHCAKRGAVGGAVRGKYKPQKLSLRIYARFWDWYAGRSKLPMTQGVCQYVRRAEFVAIGGYDESLYFAEDTDFYWRLDALARRERHELVIPHDLFVLPSSRRMDKWPAWKVIFWTNPYMSRLRLKSAGHWRNWYGRNTVR